MSQEKKDRRKLNKQKRKMLMGQQEELSDNFCTPCLFNAQTGLGACKTCPVFGTLRQVGEQLENLSKSSFVVPAELTWSGYLLLREKEWTKKDIARHYGIPIVQFNEFVASNENPQEYRYKESYKELTKKDIARHYQMPAAPFKPFAASNETPTKYKHKEMNELTTQETTKIKPTLEELTPEAYRKLIKSGKTDGAVIELYNASYYTLSSWKKKHGIAKEKDAPKKSTPAQAAWGNKLEQVKKELVVKDEIIKQKDAELQEANALLAQRSSDLAFNLESLQDQSMTISKFEEEIKQLNEQLNYLKSQSPQAVASEEPVPEPDEDGALFEYLLLKRLTKANEQLVQFQRNAY